MLDEREQKKVFDELAARLEAVRELMQGVADNTGDGPTRRAARQAVEAVEVCLTWPDQPTAEELTANWTALGQAAVDLADIARARRKRLLLGKALLVEDTVQRGFKRLCEAIGE